MSGEIQSTETKERIIKAAFKEFTEKGYTNASTNKIVEDAGVSKGVLFYHFGDKEKLYTYLVEHVTELLTEDILTRVDFENSDVFDFLCKTTNTKLLTLTKYPLEVKLYTSAFISNDIPQSARAVLDKNVEYAFQQMSEAMKRFDESLLKEGMDTEKVFKFIDWACKGMIDEVVNNENLDYDMENYMKLSAKIENYFDFMRKLFYKEDK